MQDVKPTTRAKDVALTIANTEYYALRKGLKSDYYNTLRGDYTKEKSDPPSPNHHRDLVFRSVGSPIQCGSGWKELHMSVKGTIKYDLKSEFEKLLIKVWEEEGEEKPEDPSQYPIPEDLEVIGWYKKPDNMPSDMWARILRYNEPLVHLDLEIWSQSRGPHVPLRTQNVTDIDNDWSRNFPQSRTDLIASGKLYSSSRAFITGQKNNVEDINDYIQAKRSIAFGQEFPLPISRVQSLSHIVVPVITLHVGGRAIGLTDLDIQLQASGVMLYEV